MRVAIGNESKVVEMLYWLLVSEPGLFEALADFGRVFFGGVGISVHQQYSLLDTIINYMSFLDLQENIYKKVKKTDYPSAGFAGRPVVGFGDLSIDIFLEVQNKTYC